MNDNQLTTSGEQPPSSGGALVAIEQSRAVQEVQASMVIAKRFPRDEMVAHNKIMNACRRRGLAEAALYSYPKGGTMVTGPSIRMAEAVAQCWGNLDFGIRELDQKSGESTVEAFCFDKESNTRQVKVFQVKHERHTKRGVTKLKDPRDIYELVANQGARRVRACILGIIPGDIIESAVAECERTLQGDNQIPLIDRLKVLVEKFAEFGVTKEMIEKRLGHNMDATSETEGVQLGKILRGLRDGMAKREQFFDFGDAGEQKSDLNEPAPDEKKSSGGKKKETKTSANKDAAIDWTKFTQDKTQLDIKMSNGKVWSGVYVGVNGDEVALRTVDGMEMLKVANVSGVEEVK